MAIGHYVAVLGYFYFLSGLSAWLGLFIMQFSPQLQIVGIVILGTTVAVGKSAPSRPEHPFVGVVTVGCMSTFATLAYIVVGYLGRMELQLQDWLAFIVCAFLMTILVWYVMPKQQYR